MKHKIIIDSDPGIDDAMAILFACEVDDFNILGLSSVFGNVDVQNTTNNAMYLSKISKKNWPVFVGSATPLLVQTNFVYHIHGKKGMGDKQDIETIKVSKKKPVWQFIVDTVKTHKKKSISLVMLGPLTNLAKAINLEPNLHEYIHQVIIMGGSFFVDGNVSKWAEANIYSDPHAAKIVFNSNLPIIAMGLDVTSKALFTKKLCEKLMKTSKYGDLFSHIMPPYMNFYKSLLDKEALLCHDVFPFMFLIKPELFTVEKARVHVSISGENIGQTTPHLNEYGNVKICTNVKARQLINIYEKAFL